MKNKKVKIVVLIVMVLLATVSILFRKNIISVFRSGGTENSELNTEQNSTVTVKTGDIEMSIAGSGNIESKLVKELKTQNGGIVSSIYVREGEKIEKGDVILELNNDTDNISINQGNLSIFEEEMNLKKLKESVSDLKVKAPFSGVVTETFIDEGDTVSAGQELLKIVDKSVLEAVAPFNKTVIDKINVGDSVNVVFQNNMETTQGKITKISDQGYGTEYGGLLYDVTVEIKNPGALIEGTEVQIGVNDNSFIINSTERSKLKWKSDKSVELKASGKLTKILVQKGQKVTKGQIIAEIENENLTRDIQIQEKHLENTRLELNKKKNELSDNIILSPISGTLIELGVVSGENILQDSTVGKITDLENLEVTIPIDELDILKIKNGQEAIINTLAMEGTEFRGKVTNISQVGKVENGFSTYNVTVSIDNPKDLKLGMSAKVRILIDSKKDALLVPLDCITTRDHKSYVKVKDTKDEIKEIEVQIGLVSNDFAEIVSGELKDGDNVLKGMSF